MKKQRKCYIYTRVSTAIQVDGYSLDAQKDKLRKYAEYQDMTIVSEFSDEGFLVNNEIFAENSWYFRNSLARANYNDLGKGISATTVYLERFFENLLLGYQNELKNRFIHVDYKEQSAIQSAIEDGSKCNNCTLEELAILKELLKNPSITQKELAGIIGKSERTIKTRTVEMQEKGLIRRENGKRNGRWEVLVKL